MDVGLRVSLDRSVRSAVRKFGWMIANIASTAHSSRTWLGWPCQVEQEGAIRHRDRPPWLVGRHNRDYAGTDLDRVFLDPYVNPAVQNLKGHTPALVVLVKGRARAKYDQNQSEGASLGQCSGVAIAFGE